MRRGPTPPRAARTGTYVEGLDHQVTAALQIIHAELGEMAHDSPIDKAMSQVEMFIAIALRVMSKANPSKVRSEARNVEIQARMDGKPESGAEPLAGPPQLDAEPMSACPHDVPHRWPCEECDNAEPGTEPGHA